MAMPAGPPPIISTSISRAIMVVNSLPDIGCMHDESEPRKYNLTNSGDESVHSRKDLPGFLDRIYNKDERLLRVFSNRVPRPAEGLAAPHLCTDWAMF